jgi:penicillin-binding protein A
VNGAITRLFLLVIVLFAVLVAFTSRWSVFEAEALRENGKNQRATLRGRFVARGAIRAADGTVLARSVRNADETYTRRYPQPELFPHAVGYSYTRIGQSGTERFRNDALIGDFGQVESIFDRLGGGVPRGAEVRTALNPRAQRVALEQLRGRKGAVVALDPQTGAVEVMASTPGYDQRSVSDPDRFGELAQDEANAPLVNRTTQGLYPPGSTMKVVTAIAAVDSGRFSPDSTVDGSNGKVISGTPLQNFGGADFGPITLTDALTNSVNTAWAAVGERLGKATMGRYMRRLGFGRQVRVDLPGDERAPSGAFAGGRPIEVTDDRVDVGRLAIGQDRLLATPLQMAMVAAAVANDGVLMEPHITQRVVDRDGRVVEDLREGERMSRVMSARSARVVRDMMGRVVEEGSGTAAALEGIRVAGKTGTAEVGGREGCTGDQLWFIALAPAPEPRSAIAVTLECEQGTGGTVAAPIAKAVMQELLR